MIKVLDDVTGYKTSPGEQDDLALSLGERYPFLVVPVLQKRGLVASTKESRDVDLEKEPEAWIQSIYRSYKEKSLPLPIVSSGRLGS